MMPRPILIDTDTGVDDALALIFALRSPELSVKAITTVAGNVEVEQCTRNVLFLLRLLRYQQKVVVSEGASKPLKRALVTAPEVHGRDGLGDLSRRNSEKASVPREAVDTIIQLSQKFGKHLTIVVIGPLTNIAHALKKNPRAIRKIGSLFSMGGAFCVHGNTGPVSEFNYFVDPDAAQFVLNSGLPVTVIPLDVTEQIAWMRRDLQRWVNRRKNAVGATMLRFMELYMRYHRRSDGFDGGYLHDPIAVVASVHPRFIETKPMRVSVELNGRWMRGMTSAVHNGPKTSGSTVKVAVAIDREKIFKLLRARLWE